MDIAETKPSSNFQFKYIPVLIIGVSGVLLHVILLIALIRDPLRCFRNSATYLIANLAVSDLILSICGPFTLFGRWDLRIISGIAFGVSVLAIFSIAIDRFIMVTYPFKHQYLMSGKKIILWITFFWILSSFRSFAETMLLPTNVYSFTIQNCLAVAIILLSGILYVSIFISLRKQTKNLALHCASGSNRSQATRLLKEKQFVRTIILVALIAIIGIVPYSIAWFVLVRNGKLYDKTLAMDILMCFLMTLFFFTFASNPLIYFMRLPRYRKSFYILYWRQHLN